MTEKASILLKSHKALLFTHNWFDCLCEAYFSYYVNVLTGSGSAIYTRWGRQGCPDDAELIYSG